MRRPMATMAGALASLLMSGVGHAQSEAPSANDFGGIGLLETRTARMSEEGSFEIGGFAREPYRGFYLLAQPLPWLEVNFRYSDLTNVRRDGTVLPLSQIDFLEDLFGFKGGGAVRDRGFDIKLRLVEESRYLPAVAIGLQDMFGDARFGGEYVVASKRFGPFDFSFGIGWGFLGSRDQIGNPLSFIDNGLESRRAREGQGGLNASSYFAGNEVAFFGGVEWFTPLDGLSLKLEYSGVDPARGPFGAVLDQDLPVNFGVAYRPLNWLDLSVGFERGNTVMTRASVRFDLFDLPMLRKPGPSLAAPEPEEMRPASDSATPESLDLTLARYFAGRGWAQSRISAGAMEATLDFAPENAPPESRWAEEARQLFRLLPHGVIRLWIRRQDDSALKARLFRRGEQERDAARMIARLGDAGPVVIDGDLLQLSKSVTLTDTQLLALPPAVSGIRTADGASKDVRAQKALAEARLLGSLLPEVSVRSLQLQGNEHLSLIMETGIQSESMDADALAEAADARAISFHSADDLEISETEAKDIFETLGNVGIRARAVAFDADSVTLWVADSPDDREVRMIGAVSRLLTAVAPAGIEHIRIIRAPGDFQTYGIDLLRRDIRKALQGQGSPEEIWLTSRLSPPRERAHIPADAIRNGDAAAAFRWGVAPVLEQTIGDNDSGMVLVDFSVDLLAELELMPGLSLSGALRRFIAGNLDNLSAEETPGLPVARSNFRDFITEGRTAIPYLQADYRFALSPEILGRVSAGLFERMYGGVSGELYYRPQASSLAFTGEMNWVKQRDPDGLFGFSGRDVVTGEIGAIKYFPGGVEGSLRAGRYLAGDLGMTVEVSRRFDNGVRLGGFMTWSEDADLDFRSDSLNKGVYISLPIGGWWPYSGPRESVAARFDDIARDSGARLILNQRLYEFVSQQSALRISEDWRSLLD